MVVGGHLFCFLKNSKSTVSIVHCVLILQTENITYCGTNLFIQVNGHLNVLTVVKALQQSKTVKHTKWHIGKKNHFVAQYVLKSSPHLKLYKVISLHIPYEIVIPVVLLRDILIYLCYNKIQRFNPNAVISFISVYGVGVINLSHIVITSK